PIRRPAGEAGAREDREARVTRPLVLATAAVAQADVREQAREQRPMHELRLGRLAVDLDARVARRLAELRDEVLPLAHAQVVQELAAAALAELIARQRTLLLAQVAPQVEVGGEVGVLVGEA